MDEINKAIAFAMGEYKKEFGEDAKLEDGDQFVSIFNDAVLILGLEDKTLKVQFICGKPYYIDYSLNMTEPSKDE